MYEFLFEYLFLILLGIYLGVEAIGFHEDKLGHSPPHHVFKDETEGIMLPYLTLNWQDRDWIYEHCDQQGIEILG